MVTSFSVAIYPSKSNSVHKIKQYLKMVKQYGCKEIFSSAHLPELTLTQQIDSLLELSTLVRQEELTFTVDLGGQHLFEILHNEQLTQKVANLHIDFLRLDYGYDLQILPDLIHKLGIHGFVWNASIMSEEDVDQHMAYVKQFKNIKILACHNFYPRRETGLDSSFLKQQFSYFKKYDIPVTTCISSITNPRGPLYEGLPTLENHRFVSVGKATMELIKDRASTSILVSDEFIAEEECKCLCACMQREPIPLQLRVDASISKEEEHILFGQVHHIRYDSNTYILRSQSSRQMAEYAMKIKPRETAIRHPLCVSIDNEKYLRYSGEVQIVLKELPLDPRVNVVGYIATHDAWKLAYANDFDFLFIRM